MSSLFETDVDFMRKISLFLIMMMLSLNSFAETVHEFSLTMELEEGRHTFVVEMEEAPGGGAMLYSVDETESIEAAMAELCLMSGGIEPGFVYDEVFNGFSVEADAADYEDILSLPGVKNVYVFDPVPAPELFIEDATDMSGVTYVQDENNTGYDGEGEIIAVIDNEFNVNHEFFGVEPSNPALTAEHLSELVTGGSLQATAADSAYKSAKIPYAYDYVYGDYDVSGAGNHGTCVAGIAAGNNSSQSSTEPLCGVAPQAQLLLMKIATSSDMLQFDAALKAIDDAVTLGATAINMSFGITYASKDVETVFNQALAQARELGIAVCTAAGNSARGYTTAATAKTSKMTVLPQQIDYGSAGVPATVSEVFTIAAADKLASPADYSSWGVGESLELLPEITAVGSSIKSSVKSGGYALGSGTSMASPFMAGVLALMSQHLDGLAAEDGLSFDDSEKVDLMESLLMSTATVMSYSGVPYSPRRQGAGVVNVKNAVETKAYLKGEGGTTKINLGDKLSNVIDLSFTIVNEGTETAVYTPSIAVSTDKAENGKLSEYPVEIPVISTTLPDSVIVREGTSMDITFTVTLDEDFCENNLKTFTNGFYTDGFIFLEGEDVPSLNIPFMGFYGAWTEQSVFDTSLYDDGGSYLKNNGGMGTYLYSKMPNGSTTKSYVLGTDDKGLIDGRYNAISPNGDGYGDELYINMQLMRAVKKVDIQIYGNDITINAGTANKLVSKYGAMAVGLSKLDSLEEGDYSLGLSGALNHTDGENSPSLLLMPFTVDKTTPEICGITISEDRSAVTVTAKDNNFVMAMGIVYYDTEGNSHTLSDLPDNSTKEKGDEVSLTFATENIDPSEIYAVAWDYAYNKAETMVAEDLYVNSSLAEGNLSYTVVNNTGSTVAGTLYGAFYNGDKLICVKEAVINSAETEISDTITITEDISAAAYYKILLWDDTLTPLTGGVKFHIE